MGSYITQGYLEEALPGGVVTLKRITRAGSGALDDALIASAILSAEAEIDSYAAGTPGHPWSTVPEQVKTTAFTLAMYALYSRCWSSEEVPAQAAADREAALDFLRSLRAGARSADPLTPPELDASRRIITSDARTRLGSTNPRRFALSRWGW